MWVVVVVEVLVLVGGRGSVGRGSGRSRGAGGSLVAVAENSSQPCAPGSRAAQCVLPQFLLTVSALGWLVGGDKWQPCRYGGQRVVLGPWIPQIVQSTHRECVLKRALPNPLSERCLHLIEIRSRVVTIVVGASVDGIDQQS